MRLRFLPILTLIALTACGTPQEQCIARETRELRTVERLIAEAEENLRRGYALEERTIWVQVWDYCDPPRPRPPADGSPPPPPPPPRLCLQNEPQTVTRPVAIDPAEERRKLEGLIARRAELSRAAEAAIAECKRLYPE